MRLFDLKILPYPGNKKAERLLKTIQDNAQEASDDVAYDAAKRFLEKVDGRMAKEGERFQPLRKSLEMIHTKLADQDVYAVISNLKWVDPEELEGELTAIYVIPKKDEEWLRLLEQYSPWPMTMLPVMPEKTEATMVSRKIRQDEMEKLRQIRKPDLEKVLSLLRAYDIDTTIDTAEVEVEIVVDTHWEAVRAEFGLDGFNRVPIWQPALKEILRDREHIIRTMEEALVRPRPNPVDREATAADLTAIKGFQGKMKV